MGLIPEMTVLLFRKTTAEASATLHRVSCALGMFVICTAIVKKKKCLCCSGRAGYQSEEFD